jgi:cytochrome c peroxidase
MPRAAALVGETPHVDMPAVPIRPLHQIREAYRHPASIPFPVQNRYTPETVQLGRMLYNDTRLSGSGTLACASCHNPGFGHSDSPAKTSG